MPSKSGNTIPIWSRRTVRNRSLGRCERCGGPGAQWHHRRGRSVRDQHRHCPCNGVWLCPTCHDWCHRNPIAAVTEGFIIPRAVSEPGTKEFLHYQGRWVQAACDGTLSTVETKEE